MDCKDYFLLSELKLVYSKPNDFIKFQCGYHKLYIVWRIFWALYHLVWIILTGVYSYQWAGDDPAQQVKWFIYLTNWAYFVLTFSTTIGAVCVVYIAVKRDDILQGACSDMPWYLKVDWVFFNVSNSVSILVAMMYWGLIYSSSSTITAVNIETHGLNMVYVLVNLFLTGIPVRFYHLFHPMVFGTTYIVFSIIYEVSGGTNAQNKSYIYSTFDWSNTGFTSGLSLITVLVAIPVCHIILFLLYLLRIFVNKKFCFPTEIQNKATSVDNKSFSPENYLELKDKNEVKIDMDTPLANKKS
ncbi:protein rolling stone-like [Mytilus californianus]|uniref:protein rolling stone-like n=1 Tax=Mytilus californianus TaxID=6549 RepID=UPI002247A429|nr:protein rolling stone-like [Mytilus californianus]